MAEEEEYLGAERRTMSHCYVHSRQVTLMEGLSEDVDGLGAKVENLRTKTDTKFEHYSARLNFMWGGVVATAFMITFVSALSSYIITSSNDTLVLAINEMKITNLEDHKEAAIQGRQLTILTTTTEGLKEMIKKDIQDLRERVSKLERR